MDVIFSHPLRYIEGHEVFLTVFNYDWIPNPDASCVTIPKKETHGLLLAIN
jgi:hypothetical protein